MSSIAPTPETHGHRIVGLQATNFKRLRAVEIVPDGNVVVLSGRNAQGKSSILDAIEAALTGVDRKKFPQPIRDGELFARVVLDLDDLRVTRTWEDGKDSKLVVEAKDGVRISKAQATLDSLLGSLSFDPLAFASMGAKAQVEALLDVVDLPFDPDELEAERLRIFTKRTDVNRRARDLEGEISNLPDIPRGTPLVEESLVDLLSEVDQADREWAGLARARMDVDEALDVARVQEEHIKDLERRLDEARDKLVSLNSKVEEAQGHLAGYDLDRMPDREHLRGRLSSIEDTNRHVRTHQRKVDLTEVLEKTKGSAASLTVELQALDQQKRDGLQATKMPVDGLSFDEDGVIYTGIPFKQASSAEQLRVSFAMAMALKPGLRVIRISDGSLLDSDSLRIVSEMAAENDFQVWIEMVDETGALGFVIEDGMVSNA